MAEAYVKHRNKNAYAPWAFNELNVENDPIKKKRKKENDPIM